jgi:hypothetical protein
MESAEHQEWRARQGVRGIAIVKTAVFAGAVLFLMSGGGPWSTAGTMNVIMGRDIPLNYFLLALGHFAVSLIYVFVIAQVIYRFRLVSAIGMGMLVAIGLYGINFAIFHALGAVQHSPESKTFFVHLVFGAIASALYKAFSVPRPIKASGEATVSRT